MQRVVIIGAGLTGLSAAYHLQDLGIQSYELFEQHPTVGGLTRSVHESGFTFDYTGHFLHSNNPYFSQLITSLFSDAPLASIARRAFVFSHNTYTPYPFQANLSGLPLNVICECVEGVARQKRHAHPPKNFREWLLRGFGKGLCKHFFFPYNRKILSYPLHKAMPEQGGRFVPSTSFHDIMRNLLAPTATSNLGYNAAFLYPRTGGIQELAHRLHGRLNVPTHTNHTVAAIDPYKKSVLFTNGTTAFYDTLISTMPLDTLLRLTTFGTRSNLAHQHKNLICNTVINLNLGVNRPTVDDKHWIYFPEKKFSFYRLGFWSAISKHMAPEGMSSLYGETSMLNPSPQEISRKLTSTKREILKLFDIKPSEICMEKTLTLQHAYVIHDEWRKENLPTLLSTLSSEFNIYSVGRFGSWKYSSMQEAILDGQQTAVEIAHKAAQFHIPPNNNAHQPHQ